MALKHLGAIEFQTSPESATVSAEPALYYDAYADELVFKFDQSPQQTFVVPVNDVVSLLYADGADEVVGIQIDAFTMHAVPAFPELGIIAKVTGIAPREAGDTLLFRRDRTVRTETAFTTEDEAEFKRVIRHIVDVTGGFDADIVIERGAS